MLPRFQANLLKSKIINMWSTGWWATTRSWRLISWRKCMNLLKMSKSNSSWQIWCVNGWVVTFIQLLLADGALTVGRLFYASTRYFFTKAALTQERKVAKLFPRWEINGLSEGYKQAIDQYWGLCFGHNRKKLFKKKGWLFPNKYQSLKKFWVFLGIKRIFGQKNTFRPNVKTAVSP